MRHVAPALSIPTCTLATRPAAASFANYAIHVSDAALGQRLQVSDGSAWIAQVPDLSSVGAPNTQTASYTAVLLDAGKSIEMNAAGATTFTLPLNATVAFPIGTIIEVARIGAGAVTIHPTAGVLIRNKVDVAGTADRTIANQYSAVSLRKRATDEWVLVGDLA